MDPPGSHQHPGQLHPAPPQPFEIALIRKIEAKTRSVHDAFLLLDIDNDGHISPSDLRTVLHNEFGLDPTPEQEDCFFAHIASKKNNPPHCENGHDKSMTYAEFAKYFNHVTSCTTLTTTESGFAAAMGFHRNDEHDKRNGGAPTIDREASIHLTQQTILLQLRHDLRARLTAHSSRAHGSGMKETSLFLAMDVHRSGKVTMQEFLDWLHSVGMTWSMDELKMVVLGLECEEGEEGWKAKREERVRLEKKWFGSTGDGEKGVEPGMTEHEFGLFVESLDVDGKNISKGMDP